MKCESTSGINIKKQNSEVLFPGAAILNVISAEALKSLDLLTCLQTFSLALLHLDLDKLLKK